MTLFKKKKQRPVLFSQQSYDAEAHKTEQPFVYEGVDIGWTTSEYPIPKDFLQFYHIDFNKQAAALIDAVDEGVPHYMDQHIYNATAEALAFLIHKHSAHAESISEIISRKRVTKNCHERELEAIMAERARIETIVEEIGGYDYDTNC